MVPPWNVESLYWCGRLGSFLARNLAALLAGLRQTDGDGLLAALHAVAVLFLLEMPHLGADFARRFLAILPATTFLACHKPSLAEFSLVIETPGDLGRLAEIGAQLSIAAGGL